MKYVIFSNSGEGEPVALKLKQEGNWVLLAQEPADPKEDADMEKRRLSQYDGMLSKMPAQEAVDLLLNVPDKENYFVWFDFNHLFKYADQLKGKGFKGNFPTEEDRKFEENREFAKSFVKEHYPNVSIGEVHEFKTKDEASQFLEGTEEIFVLKGKEDGAKTVVPTSEDPILAKQEIEDALEDPAYEQSGFILELKISNPIEITPEKVFWNGEPLFTNVDIENKKIGAGEIGCMTGCAQDLVVQTDIDSYLNEIAFPPIVDELAKQHEGLFIWDISLIFDGRTGKCYMGEFCPNRNGYNAFYTELSMLPRVSDYFESISKGENPYDKSTGRFGASVRLFSLNKEEDLTAQQDNSIMVKPESDKWTYLMNAKDENGKIVMAGYWWQKEYADVAAVVSYGDSLEEAAGRAYEAIKGIAYSSMFYRPLFDFLSFDYETSIPNRWEFLTKHKLITIPDGDLAEGTAPSISPYIAKRKAGEKEYDAHYKAKYESDLAKNKEEFRGKIKEISQTVKNALNEG